MPRRKTVTDITMGADWADPKGYDGLAGLDWAGWAWEWLKRNRGFAAVAGPLLRSPAGGRPGAARPLTSSKKSLITSCSQIVNNYILDMRVISRRRLREYWEANPRAEEALRRWYMLVDKARWRNHADLRAEFPSADYVGNDRYVFNIGGNNFRLVTVVDFMEHGVLIRWVGTHAEYDRIDVRTV